MMPRYFTLVEAERILPRVERALRDALFQKSEYEAADRQLNQALEKIRMVGGSRVNPGPLLAMRARRDTNAKALKVTFESIEEMGVMVKDLETGLIDFITRYHGRDVCLCWKLGEEGITQWHGMEEGFRGRKPIDAEFRAHHSADGGGNDQNGEEGGGSTN
jgi:hypothetical protein